MVEIRHYPEMSSIANLLPSPQILLGKRISWQEKRDGTNLAVTLVDNEIKLFTRHQEASEQFVKYFWATEEAVKVENFLHDYTWTEDLFDGVNDFSFQPVVFGELLIKGKSPARFELHDKHEFVVFDIWNTAQNRFLPYIPIYQHCYHYSLPIVSCWGVSRHTTLESLYTFRDEMLLQAKEAGREGVVLKTFDGNQHIFAKEKLDVPIIEKVQMDDGAIRLPPLPDSEVYGAINKAHADLGEDFRDKTKAMPLIAIYTAAEEKKHLCSKPLKSLYSYYLAYLEGFGEGTTQENL